MSDQDKQTLHTEGVVGDYFLIESHILSTRAADAYKAIDKSRNSPVCLWMLRYPFQIGSDVVRRFLDRMYKIDQIDPAVTDMLAYGVDAAGTAFALFPPLDGHVVIGGNIEAAEAERRFLACLRLVDKLHAHGITCSDLCASSFWIHRDGELRFLGSMGTFDVEAAATAMAPPADTLPFLAPEQRTGAVSLASDVFALGVLGYYLLTKRYPYGEGVELLASSFEVNQVPQVSSLIPSPPVWANEVLRRCLDPDPSQRYPRAGAIVDAITEIRNRAMAAEASPVSRAASSIRPAAMGDATNQVQAFQPPDLVRKQEAVPDVTPPRKRSLAMPFLAVLGVAIGAGVSLAFFQDETSSAGSLRDELSQHLEAVNDPGLKDAINAISVQETDLQEKRAKLERIVNSDDPLAHDILVKSASEATNEALRSMAEQAIIDRARRLGLHRTAEQVRLWLRGLPRGQMPRDYEAILKCLDKTLPREARDAAIRQAYASNPRVAMRIAVALALDLNQLDAYQLLIAQLVGDSLGVEDLKQYSALSLILAHHELAMVFGEDVIQKREQIPNNDVLWLLKQLADRGDLNVRAISSMAVERGLLPATRALFLTIIRDRGDLSSDVLNALIRSAAGSLKKEDLATLGRWYDRDVERILLAILASYREPDLLRDAFDTLAARTIAIEPSASLVDWIRRNYWDERTEFAAAVGVLANLDLVEQAEVDRAFDSFDRYVRDTDLIDILLETEHPKVLRMVVQKYSDQLGLGMLLDLLDNPDSEVRMTAVRSLKSYNDIGALKLIIDHYERERDPKVRQAYQETFWVIREREEGPNRVQ